MTVANKKVIFIGDGTFNSHFMTVDRSINQFNWCENVDKREGCTKVSLKYFGESTHKEGRGKDKSRFDKERDIDDMK